MEHASVIAIEILNASRRWVAARVILRRALDSKSASQQQIDQAKRDHQKASDELEALVMRLERFLHNTGNKVSMQKGQGLGQQPKSAFPWRAFFGMVSAGAKAVETALVDGPKKPGEVIIDVDPKK